MEEPPSKPRIGLSSCLLGCPVRYNGGHKRHDWLAGELAGHVEWVLVCPEMEMGLGAPREPVRLVDGRMLGVRTGTDHTQNARQTATRLTERLAAQGDLDGYVLKKGSPSCGAERVKVYGVNGMPLRTGRGIFAEHLRAALPLLPITEEGRLNDPAQRAHFVTRVYAWHRLKQVPPEASALQRFHQSYKLVLMEHSPAHYQRLGQLVANPGRLPLVQLLAEYQPLFMQALELPGTVNRRVNVLHHMYGYLKDVLDRREKREVLELIEDYRQGEVPLAAPLAVLRHLIRKFSIEYLDGQLFFQPYPKGLGVGR